MFRWGCTMLRLLLAVLIVACPFAASAQDCAPIPLQQELLKRNEVDQAARKVYTASPESKEASDRVLQIDRENTTYMRTVLAKCGWPRRSEVGEQAAKAAWRLTQHADMDPEYQILASRQMKLAVLAKEAEPWDLAVLVDRNRRLNDQLQVYGMQFFATPGGSVRFYDIVSPAMLDSRRMEIGLPPFFCWASSISKDKSAPIEWPAGVPFQHSECQENAP